jgi:hypothetical protein
MKLRIVSALFACALAAATCSAQYLASISGIITDPQGAVIPQASVSVTNVATGLRTAAQANSAGFYLIPNLPIGTYKLSVEHPGFRKVVREGITLTTGERLGLDIALELGATGQSVTVTGEAPLIESRTSEVGTLMEAMSIAALPLSGRKTLNIVALSGAAVFLGYPNTPSGSPSFSLGGGRGRSQMAFIDGGSIQNSRIGNALIDSDLPVDAVAEVKVLTNSYAAEYGASASGVVLETTKSGTNQLHGSAYEYFRNDAMDAPGFFAPIAQGQKVAPELRYNVFGATAGGPIRKGKTFFFFSYEGQRLRSGSSLALTVPTLLQRQGDFSQTFNASGRLIPIYDPATTATSGGTTTRQQFPNNVIPQSARDPVAMAMLAYYPLPSQPPSNAAGANNFSGNRVSIIPSDSLMGKLDHNFSAKDRVMARYLRLVGTASIASPYPNGGAGDPGPGSDLAERWAVRIFGNWTHVVSTTQVNDFRFAYNDRLFHQLSAGLGGGYPSKLGLKGVPDTAFPAVSPSGFSAIGSTSQERIENPIRTEQYIDNYSWNRGRHALKLGAEIRRTFHGDIQRSTVSGNFGFSTLPTGLPGNTSTGNGLASMLTGFVTSFAEVSTDHLYRHMYYFAAFAQDDWTVRPSLTLNLGLRWETDTPMVADDNHMNSFDLSQINPVSGTPGVVKFMGLNGYTTSPYATHWKNFGPRLGFAWKPFNSSKTVVRGGTGLFFAHPFDASVGNTAALGFGTSASLSTPDNGITPAFYLRNGVPVAASAPALGDSFGAVRVGQSTTTSVTFFDPHRGVGYSEQFNLGIQRELPGAMVLEITALGNLSRKLANDKLSLNQIPPQILGPQHSSQRDRPFAQFTDVAILFPTLGASSYYGGMLRVQKRYSHGLNFGASYTWSKYLANISASGIAGGNNAGIYSNYYDRRPDYGPNADDVAHRLNFHWVYELPFGAGKRWLAKNPLRFVVGGWSIGNVATFQSGFPNTVTTQTNNSNCFSAGAQRPNVVGDPNSGTHSVAAWFNTAALTQPAIYTFGNAAAGIIRGPGLINLDFSVLRNFRITERIHAELRGEFINALNHTNFGNPGTALGSATFGVISSAGPARQIQVGARIVF